MGEQRAHRLRGFGAVYAQFLPGCTGGRCKNSSVRLETLLRNIRKGRDTGSLYPAPCGYVAQCELFNLGSLLFLEVTHLRQVFTAGCGVQACFIRTLRQLGELAVAALVVDHADADGREEEDE